MKKISVFILIVLVLALAGYYLYSSGQIMTEAPESTPTVTNAMMLKELGSYRVIAEDVNYFEDVDGYFARPETRNSYPGVVMIHEWWGLNDNIKDMARRLASFGYNVLAVDLYNGRVATTSEEARGLTSSLDQEKAIANMKEAATFLRNENSTKVASLGWCFGGGQSLQLALADGLEATVIYYGDLVTEEADLAAIQHPVLGVFGDRDQSIPISEVKAFEASLDSLEVENEIYIYPGVGHAFANPSGENYAQEETQDAWNKTIAFLEKHLKQD